MVALFLQFFQLIGAVCQPGKRISCGRYRCIHRSGCIVVLIVSNPDVAVGIGHAIPDILCAGRLTVHLVAEQVEAETFCAAGSYNRLFHRCCTRPDRCSDLKANGILRDTGHQGLVSGQFRCCATDCKAGSLIGIMSRKIRRAAEAHLGRASGLQAFGNIDKELIISLLLCL